MHFIGEKYSVTGLQQAESRIFTMSSTQLLGTDVAGCLLRVRHRALALCKNLVNNKSNLANSAEQLEFSDTSV